MLPKPQNLKSSVSHKIDYSKFKDRLRTFAEWDPHSMSEAGFVFSGEKDLVYCFCCNIKLDGWTKHMDPLLRHKEESPTCSFVRQQLQVIKGEKGKVKSVVAPSKPLNPRQTASIGQLQSSSPFASNHIHTVVTGLDESRSYAGRGDNYSFPCLPITPQNYGSEVERVRSFVGWPLNESVHPEQLARVGFVYTGEGSLVQCFQCGVRYRNWLKGDVPLSVHQRCNPRCAFLQSLSCRHKQSSKQISSTLTISTLCGSSVLESADYSDQVTRLQSFKYWGGVLPKEELAEAGFYMIARRDVVRCFSCRVVLQDWERTDNVVDKHQRHSPNCQFLKTHICSILASSYTSASTDETSSINETQGCFSKASPPSPEPSGIRYPPSWRSNSPPLSPPPRGSDSEESVSSQKKLDYMTSTSLHTILESEQALCEESLLDGADVESSESMDNYYSTDYNLLPRNGTSPNRQVVVEKSEFATDWLPTGGRDRMALQGLIIPPGFSASPTADQSVEHCSLSNTPVATNDQGRRFTDVIKPRFCQAEMCKLTEDLGNNDIESMPSSDSPPIVNVGSHSVLQCQICKNHHIEFTFLPCGHTTCWTCTRPIMSTTRCCPFCRRHISTTHHIYL